MVKATDILDRENELDSTKRHYLKRFGWKETSETPGSYWLWVRDFPLYGRITAQTDIAVRMTAIELDDEDEEEDL